MEKFKIKKTDRNTPNIEIQPPKPKDRYFLDLMLMDECIENKEDFDMRLVLYLNNFL